VIHETTNFEHALQDSLNLLDQEVTDLRMHILENDRREPLALSGIHGATHECSEGRLEELRSQIAGLQTISIIVRNNARQQEREMHAMKKQSLEVESALVSVKGVIEQQASEQEVIERESALRQYGRLKSLSMRDELLMSMTKRRGELASRITACFELMTERVDKNAAKKENRSDEYDRLHRLRLDNMRLASELRMLSCAVAAKRARNSTDRYYIVQRSTQRRPPNHQGSRVTKSAIQHRPKSPTGLHESVRQLALELEAKTQQLLLIESGLRQVSGDGFACGSRVRRQPSRSDQIRYVARCLLALEHKVDD
jgi:hypothetical protein